MTGALADALRSLPTTAAAAAVRLLLPTHVVALSLTPDGDVACYHRLVADRETGRPKGFGFCEFFDVATAESAHRNLNGYELGGRTMRIDFAEDFQTRRPGGGGGPGGGGDGRPPVAPQGPPSVVRRGDVDRALHCEQPARPLCMLLQGFMRVNL
jgi:hypothetical protein